MYRTAQEEEWDSQNAFTFAMEKARKAGFEKYVKSVFKQQTLKCG